MNKRSQLYVNLSIGSISYLYFTKVIKSIIYLSVNIYFLLFAFRIELHINENNVRNTFKAGNKHSEKLH